MRAKTSGSIQRLRRCAIVLLALAAVRATGQGTPARGQDREPPAGGLDLVIVVDVSRSMYTTARHPPERALDTLRDPPDGSDPNRNRWAAVRLILNLLTVEDRALIVPFNHVAPATDARGERIPSALPERFVAVNDDDRSLVETVQTFIHSRNNNHDSGGTQILNALRKAAELGGPPSAGRKRSAILLTDGWEGDRKVGASTGADERWLRAQLGPWAAGSDETPVYTIGLGPDCDERLLLQIAKLTGGSFDRIPDSVGLIEAFRRLVWTMKGCWIKRIDMAAEARDVETMAGVVDLGVLSYGVGPGRDTYALESPFSPAFAWQPDAANGPAPRLRGGAGRSGYAYQYFGRSSLAQERPFGDFDPAGSRLVSGWTPARPPRRHYTFMAKRTAYPLFVMTEPSEQQTYQRHQVMRVRVEMREMRPFQADDFTLSLTLTPHEAGGRPGAAAAPTAPPPLRRVPGQAAFVAEVPLRTLPRRAGAAKEFFTLAVTARGEPARGGALAGFSLELPPRTIEVRNTFRLLPVARVELTGESSSRRVSLRAEDPIVGAVPLRVRLIPPRTKSGPVSLAAFLIDAGSGDAHPTDEGAEVVLRDGRAEVVVALDPHAPPKAGVLYQDGILEFTSDDAVGLVPARVPLGVRIDLAQLAFTPPDWTLEAKEGMDRSPPVAVGGVGASGRAPGVRVIRVAIEPDTGAPAFRPDELWLELDGETPAPAARSVAIDVPKGRAFRIAFSPRPTLTKDGRHHYRVTASAENAAPAAGRLTIDYRAPRILVRDRVVRVTVPRGSSRQAEIPVRVEGHGSEPFQLVLRPTAQEGKRPVFSGDAPARSTSDIGLDYPGPDDAVAIPADPGGAEGPSWRSLNVLVRVPGDLPYGRYRASGVVAADNAREAEVELLVEVNALEVLAAVPDRPGAWAVSRELALNPFFDFDLTKTLRVRTALGDRIAPGQLRVSVPGPFCTEEEGDFLWAIPRVDPVRDLRPLPDGSAVELTLRFPGVVNALPDRPYRLRAFVESPGLGLDRQEVDFVVRFLRRGPAALE